jgi:hypothetical protein
VLLLLPGAELHGVEGGEFLKAAPSEGLCCAASGSPTNAYDPRMLRGFATPALFEAGVLDVKI